MDKQNMAHRRIAKEIPDVGTEWAGHLLNISRSPKPNLAKADYARHADNVTYSRAFKPVEQKAARYALLMHTLAIIGGVEEASRMPAKTLLKIIRGGRQYRPDVLYSARAIIERAKQVKTIHDEITGNIEKEKVLREILQNVPKNQRQLFDPLARLGEGKLLIAYALAGGHADKLSKLHNEYGSDTYNRTVLNPSSENTDQYTIAARHIYERLRVAARLQLHQHYKAALNHYAQPRLKGF